MSTGQKLAIAGVAAAFILFALVSAFLLPMRDHNFPGRRGMPLFVLASAILTLAMLGAIVAFAKEDEEAAHPEPEAAQETSADVEGDPAAGKQVFVSAACGSCHTLADAGATATIGPDLDQTQLPHDAIVEQVRNGGGGMPPFGDQLSDVEIQDVAAYVVSAAG